MVEAWLRCSTSSMWSTNVLNWQDVRFTETHLFTALNAYCSLKWTVLFFCVTICKLHFKNSPTSLPPRMGLYFMFFTNETFNHIGYMRLKGTEVQIMSWLGSFTFREKNAYSHSTVWKENVFLVSVVQRYLKWDDVLCVFVYGFPVPTYLLLKVCIP